MTNDYIRERCDEAIEAIYTCKQKPEAMRILESLYCEAIAEGLERAAEDSRRRHIHAESNAEGQNSEEFRMWLEVGRGHWYQEQWCRQEAERVKEKI